MAEQRGRHGPSRVQCVTWSPHVRLARVSHRDYDWTRLIIYAHHHDEEDAEDEGEEDDEEDGAEETRREKLKKKKTGAKDNDGLQPFLNNPSRYNSGR